MVGRGSLKAGAASKSARTRGLGCAPCYGHVEDPVQLPALQLLVGRKRLDPCRIQTTSSHHQMKILLSVKNTCFRATRGWLLLIACDKQKPPQKITKRFQTKKLPISSNYPSHSLEKPQCKGQAVKERRLRANLPCSNFHNKHKNAVSAMYCQFTMQCFSILARKSKILAGSTFPYSLFKNDQIKVRLAKQAHLHAAYGRRAPETHVQPWTSAAQKMSSSRARAPHPSPRSKPPLMACFSQTRTLLELITLLMHLLVRGKKKCRKDKSTYCMHPGCVGCGPTLVGKPRKKKCQNLPCPDGKVRDLLVAPMNAAS